MGAVPARPQLLPYHELSSQGPERADNRSPNHPPVALFHDAVCEELSEQATSAYRGVGTRSDELWRRWWWRRPGDCRYGSRWTRTDGLDLGPGAGREPDDGDRDGLRRARLHTISDLVFGALTVTPMFPTPADAVTASVVLPEMGHVVGIGVLWDTFGLVANPSLPSSPGADTHLTGPLAITAFNAAGGTGYAGGAVVPIENMLGEGYGDSHWREDPVDTELMTPSLNSGQSNPLSAISIQSLADMGYTVGVGQADAYSKAFTGPPRAPAPGTRMIDISDDVLRTPIMVVDEKGRLIRVIGR